MTPEQWALLRDFCRDDGAFEQLQELLTNEFLGTNASEEENSSLEAIAREQALLQLMAHLGRSMMARIQQSSNFETVLQAALDDVRQYLKCDRVAVYQFNFDWSGEFIAEAVGPGWQPLIEKQAQNPLLRQNISHCNLQRVTADTYLQENQGGRFHTQRYFAVSDIDQAGFSDCYLEMLRHFQVKAYLVAPIFKGEKLWGILAAYQNAHPRIWKPIETELVTQIGIQLGEALRLAKMSQEKQAQAEQRRLITSTADKIRRSLDLEIILNTTTEEVRQLLEADRVAVYRFNPDWSGEFIAESVTNEWLPLVESDIRKVWADTYLQENQGGRYRNQETFAVENIYTAGLYPCHVELLEQFQAKSFAIAPIFSGDQLWGLLAAYQNSTFRTWEPTEVRLLVEIGLQMGIALYQAGLFAELQQEVIERQQAEATIKQLNRDLEQRNAELVVINKELEAFSYSVSHDLRAPLRSIDGFSQALLEDFYDRLDATGQDYLQRIRKSTQRMGHLIDDLLNLSRLMRSEMRWEPIHLSTIAREIATELQQLDPNRQAEFIIQDNLVVQGDSRLLRVMLHNLFENAWKFTSNCLRTVIEFGSLTQEGSKVYFIRDNGAGFDMAYADKLFGAFQRLHRVNEFPGTGIGLATVQRIIHRHGGRVWAEGTVGQGATFYFVL